MGKLVEAGDHDPSRRKYKHVYYHSSSTTWQVVRRGFPKVMCHTDQDTVAKRAAKAWKVSVQSLRLAVGKPKHGNRTLPVRKYKHVTWHAQGKTWRVYDRKTYIGSSTILSTAVQMACKHFRVSKAELELGRPRPPHNNKTNLCKRFAILMRIYKGTCEEEPLVPCDLQDLLRRVSTSRVLQDDHASGLIFPLLASKFPEHRDAVEDAFTFDPQKSEVDNVYESLVKAAHSISTKAHSYDQVRNVGRGNMHHATLLMLLSKSLKMLRKVNVMPNLTAARKTRLAPTSSRSRMQRKSRKLQAEGSKKTVFMGKNKEAYVILPLDAALRQNISTWISFGRELRKATTPKTCADWDTEVRRLLDVTLGKVVGMSGDYRAMWIIRIYLIYRMRRDNMKRLDLCDLSVRRFMEIFPDQTKQLLQMSGGRSMLFRKVADVFTDTECLPTITHLCNVCVQCLCADVCTSDIKCACYITQCRYKGPPEYFTMWACLFQDRAVRTVSTSWLSEHENTLRLKCLEYVSTHGFPPHPGVLVTSCK